MENEEPNYIVPRPFPLNSSEMLEKSVSLDLTPERPPVQRSRLKKNKKHSERKKCETSHDLDLTTPLLSAPQLNSTAHLFNRLCTLKQAQETHPSCSDREIVRSNDDIIPPSGGIRRDLSDPGPLKEVNIPRNTSRYKDLISVDVSDESFQKLTFKPRRMRREVTRVPRSMTADGMKEPQLSDLFVSSLECEETDWNTDTPKTCNELNLESVIMDSDDVFALHSLMKSSMT